jgi:organic radical activating enzyme
MKKKIKYNCIQSLKESGVPVIIVTLPEEVEAMINACRDNDIVVAAVCDNETRKTQKNYFGLEVIHTPTLPERFPKARLIIAYHNIEDCVDQLSELGYDDFYSPLELLKNYDVSKHSHRLSQSYMQNKILINMKSHELYFDETKTYMRSLDVMITAKCSLKCKSCANLMQYYVDAKNTDHEIFSALNRLNSNVDAIDEFRIIGGEPLMNKQWANIINGILEQDANRKIFIYTNGTILPKDDQLESFNGKNVNFYITDYGKLSSNIDKLEQSLKKHNIGYRRELADNWVDCASIRKHNRTVKENELVYKECCAKKLYTLLNGKLYTCPFIANAANLKAIPDNKADYVDLLINTDDLRKKLTRLIKMQKFFPACDFCDGRPVDPTTALMYDGVGMVKAGVQTPKRLQYKEYK